MALLPPIATIADVRALCNGDVRALTPAELKGIVASIPALMLLLPNYLIANKTPLVNAVWAHRQNMPADLFAALGPPPFH
jgi:hypothetical protein